MIFNFTIATIDILATAFEGFCFYYLLSMMVDHKKDYKKITVIYGLYVLLVFVLTLIGMQNYTLKSTIQVIYYMVVYKILYSEKISKVGFCYVFYALILSSNEFICILFYSRLLGVHPLLDLHIPWVLPSLYLFAHSTLFIMVYLYRKFVLKKTEKISSQINMWPFLIAATIIVFISHSLFTYHEEASTGLGEIMFTFAGILFITTMMYYYILNYSLTDEKKEKEQMKVTILEQQYSYYLDKVREEERIRGIYHDMKNHLLLLQSNQEDSKTQDMIQSLQDEISDYENYVHTGNTMLDVIIRDKARFAKEHMIDLLTVIDFKDGDFIEPLDISTIFGNALDNAIEECMHLPDEEKLITIKSQRIHEMITITVENTLRSDKHEFLRTEKPDIYLHGFGLSNIKKAVKKYNGEYSIHHKDEYFTLNIIIPIP